VRKTIDDGLATAENDQILLTKAIEFIVEDAVRFFVLKLKST
jgi:hypothetical protein